MKKYSLNDRYAIYRRKYYEQEAKLQRMGHEMDQPLLTKNQFNNVFEETKSILKMQKDMGTRKGIGNVYQYIVREQAYPISQGLVRGLKEVYKKTGEEVNFNRFTTYEQLKQNAPDAVWDFLKEEYQTLTAQGMSGKNAKLMIAQIFFGSD